LHQPGSSTGNDGIFLNHGGSGLPGDGLRRVLSKENSRDGEKNLDKQGSKGRECIPYDRYISKGYQGMQSRGELTRQNIIEKAMHLFAAKGYYRTSIGDIAEATKLTKGGLYGHFQSKEEIWNAAYEECSRIWKSIVLDGVRDVADPLERLQRVIVNAMSHYLGAGVFEGGCLLFNSLVEFSREPSEIGGRILSGFKAFSNLLHSWLKEAEEKGMLKEGLDLQAIACFIVISINGTGPLYTASQDPAVWQQTIAQLRHYIDHLRKEG
jgi:AcrR family transcriptional regulator